MDAPRSCDKCGEKIAPASTPGNQTRLCALCGAQIIDAPEERASELVDQETMPLAAQSMSEEKTVHLQSREEDSYGPPVNEAETRVLGEASDSVPNEAPTAPPQQSQGAIPGESREPIPTVSTPHSSAAQEDEDELDETDLTGRHIAGYVIIRKLGAGGMGAVYLARQVSLDREVAVKVLPGRFSKDPAFVARFTREALTAAQLNHHNIVQVFDVGRVGKTHFIVMEYVVGEDLGKMIKRDGRMAYEDAAGYVLQAARGLAYAHRRGIIHRDIKPDNLMLNEHGVVKIADMGLAKRRGGPVERAGLDHGGEDELRKAAMGDLTGASAAMGTPSYMAPEQGRDAGMVDHRADQYSLGCTLYYLVAGKAPFTGRTSFEIISKHLSQPLEPIETHVKNVPKDLSLIIEKMLSKDAGDRFQKMLDVVSTLESYLGIDSAKGPYTPREHHVALLEKEQKDYYSAPGIKLRRYTRIGFVALAVLGFIASVVLQSYFLAAAFLGLLVLTPLFSFVINGIATKDFLFRRVRSVFFGMTLKGWAITAIGTLLGLGVLYTLGLLGPWIVVSVLAFALALGYQLVVQSKLREQRRKPIRNVQDMLKILRVRGVSEESIQDFVCRFSGERWEEFFEELFGYEDMILQRGRWAKREKIQPRKRHAVWRDPLFRWLDDIEDARRRKKEEKTLAQAEKERLQASGASEEEAEKEAKELAHNAFDEGLLGDTQMLGAGPSAEEQEAAASELRSSKSGLLSGVFKWGFRGIRMAAGLFLVGAFAINAANTVGISIPGNFVNVLQNHYYPYGMGGSIVGGAAGLLLLLSVFSKRIIAPALLLLGALACVAYLYITPMTPRPAFYEYLLYWGSMAATAASFALMILLKLATGKF